MSAEIFELELPPLSKMILAETEIGQKQGVDGVLRATMRLRGKAPAADLILSALRQVAAIRRDAELVAILDELDDILC